MGPNVGYATLQVIPSMRGFSKQLQAELTGGEVASSVQKSGEKLGEKGGSSFGKKFALASAVAIAAGLVVVKKAITGLEAVGAQFDDAFDTIRIGTGATGEALNGLNEDFKAVFQQIPTDAAAAGTAIADLNTRLGLTGEPLQHLSKQFLELSRITGTDVGSNIASVTRTFGDWNVATDDQSEALDAMFRASQATGITVDRLGQNLVKYGAPLRQFGFSFAESAAIISKFEKEGVNAELVLGSMRVALGKLARDGEPAQETLTRVVDEIKNAGSVSEANAMALELFGARAGPDMAAAIREGRFEVSELLDTVASGEETILGVSEETNDWRENLAILKNQVLVGLEPLASAVFGAFGSAVEAVTPFVLGAVDAFTRLWDAVQSGEGIGSILESLFGGADIGGFVEKMVGWFQFAWDSVLDWLENGGFEMLSGALISGRERLLDAAIRLVWVIIDGLDSIVPELFDRTVEMVTGLAAELVKLLPSLLKAAIWLFEAIVQGLTGVLPHLVSTLLSLIQTVIITLVQAVPSMARAALFLFLSLVQAVLEIVPVLVESLGAVLVEVIAAIAEMAPQVLASAVEVFGYLIEALVTVLPDLLETVLVVVLPSLVEAILGMVPDLLKSAIETFFALVLALLAVLPKLLTTLVRDVLPKVLATLTGMIPDLIDTAITVWLSIMEGLFDALPDILHAILFELVPAILGAFGSIVGQIFQVGVDIVRGLWDGLKSMWGKVTGWIGEQIGKIPNAIKSLLGIASPSRVFREIGEDTMLGFQVGIEGAMGKTHALLEAAVSPTLPPVNLSAVQPVGSAASSAGMFDGAHFNLYGTPDELAEMVARRVGDEVRFLS